MTITQAAAKSLAYRLELGSRTGRLSRTQAMMALGSFCPACGVYHTVGTWITRYTDVSGNQYDYCQICAPW